MGKGSAFGKTILIGDQFVLNGVPAILSALPYKTETVVEKVSGPKGFTVVDNRVEVPGYGVAMVRAEFGRLVWDFAHWTTRAALVQTNSRAGLWSD